MKRAITFITVLMLVTTAKAQLLESININPSEFIKGVHLNDSISHTSNIATEAVTPELSIIRQQYRLELNGDYYGKGGKPFFGETYSLGIKISGGMLLLDDVVEPWKNDADYKRVNADGKYKTQYFWTFQRKLSDSTYNAIDLELGTNNIVPCDQGKNLWKHDDRHGELGLDIDNGKGLKSGVMIWAVSGSSVSDSAMAVSLSASAYSVNAVSDTALISMSPSTPEKVIGGLFVVPRYGKGGRVQFMLAGVAVKNGNGKWALQLFVDKDGASPAADSSSQPTVTGKKGEPTPSGEPGSKTKKKSKKRKKQSAS